MGILDEMKVYTGTAIKTTVSALSFICKVLSPLPDAQERLHRELDEVFDGSSRPVLVDDQPRSKVSRREAEVVVPPRGNSNASAPYSARMEFTERFIKETMRLFPRPCRSPPARCTATRSWPATSCPPAPP
ncbi:Cytochrome P450-like, partial [Frankliniella occidentalis]